MTDRARATTEGVAEAWAFWLDQHPVSVPELIQDAVTKAVTAWLDKHGHELLRQMAEPAPNTSTSTPGTTRS